MSRDTSKQTGEPKLHPDDLFDDRELAAAKDDRLAHAGIVDQLAVLATTVTMPSNIALYGPWGSGKSGLRTCSRTSSTAARVFASSGSTRSNTRTCRYGGTSSVLSQANSDVSSPSTTGSFTAAGPTPRSRSRRPPS